MIYGLWLWSLWSEGYFSKVAGVKVYTRQNQNNIAHAVTACMGLWCHGAMHAVHACISLWCHRPMQALTAWDLKFQVCLGYTFTPATLLCYFSVTTDMHRSSRRLWCASDLRTKDKNRFPSFSGWKSNYSDQRKWIGAWTRKTDDCSAPLTFIQLTFARIYPTSLVFGHIISWSLFKMN
jgi:hypothetical protein